MPTIKMIQDPYKVEAGKTLAQSEVNYFLNWYWMEWLPAAAGKSHFGRDVKWWTLPVKPNPDGNSRKACVTKESEAFGVLVCINCYKKWEAIIPEKDTNPEWKPPPRDKEKKDTHKYYDTEWTVSTNGQKEGEGWDPQAYERLNELIRAIKKWRSADKRKKWVQMQACLQFLQGHHGIEEGATGPVRKKRKKGETPKPVYKPIEVLSDSDWDDEVINMAPV